MRAVLRDGAVVALVVIPSALVLCLLAVVAHAEAARSACWPIQWTYTAYVPGAYQYFAPDVHYPGPWRATLPPFSGGAVILGEPGAPQGGTGTTSQYGWLSERFPYVVPAGYWLILTDVDYASKQLTARNSYFILDNVVIVPSAIGRWSPRIPHIVPANAQLVAELRNNSPEDQIMTVRVAGCLLAVEGEETYSEALRRALEALR